MSSLYLSGSLAFDHIMDLPGLFKDHFLADKLHNINVSFIVPEYSEHHGGTAGNVAYSLALLGEKSKIIATAGNDFDPYKKRLEEKGIDTSTIHIDREHKTAFAYIMTDMGDNQIAAFHPGASALAYGDFIPEKDSIGLISAGCLDDIRRFPELFRKSGARFLFDPGQSIPALTGEELRNGIQDSEALFVNDYEYELIKARTGWSEGDITKATKVLIVTLGHAGSRLVQSGVEQFVVAVRPTEIVDPTGAGDAYRAGYLKGLLLGFEVLKCARLGSTVATYAIEHSGTQEHVFTPQAVAERYASTYGETITL